MTVRCDVPLSDLGLLGMSGTRTVESRSVSVVYDYAFDGSGRDYLIRNSEYGDTFKFQIGTVFDQQSTVTSVPGCLISAEPKGSRYSSSLCMVSTSTRACCTRRSADGRISPMIYASATTI